MYELRNIDAGYDTGRVLSNVSVTVPTGSVVALLGPNGAGKTTLLRVASGLLRPTSGTLTLNGKDVTGEAPHSLAKRGVCHVPEGRGIFPALTVEENLRLQARPSGESTAVARAADIFPRLGERRHQRAGTMSGGEQQMLALAAAYLRSPEVVLLDEVSMGLAPNIVDEIFDYLRTLASADTSLLLVEQYVSRALELADYVYVIKRGRIEFVGEPSEVGEDMLTESYLGALAS